VTPALREAHPTQWVTASALWPHALPEGLGDASAKQRTYMTRPALLRFESDDFMDDLARVLDLAPETLDSHEATPESFRVRPPGQDPDWEPDPSAVPLKLYQPVHGHFNLVAASLVCGIPGLPDRQVEPGHGDLVSFVLRRVDTGGELAWVEPAGGGPRRWSKAQRRAVAQGEELLPMFPINWSDGDLRRRVFVGLIPTSSRETYRNAGVAGVPAPEPAPGSSTDPRVVVLTAKVIDPLAGIDLMPDAPSREASSPFVALELAEFLADNVPGWRELLEGADPPPGAATGPLFEILRERIADPARGTSWLAAVRAAWAQRLALCDEVGTPTVVLDLKDADAVTGQVAEALPPLDAAQAGPSSESDPAAAVPKLNPSQEARYQVRCVYQRPQCGPLHEDLVSGASEEFAIASFFDLDAPQRTVQISMPLDTSPAGLRKARKNVTFLLSDQLKQQMSRVGQLKDMVEGNAKTGEPLDIGLVCSFSIPIITICALIVLMIFIQLLNIIFWWLPFFKICLPVGVKGKP
jgi:hypothetical protein